MRYKDKSLMVKRDDRVPFWISRKNHSILRRIAFKEEKPMYFFADIAIAEWLRKNYKIK